MKMGSQESGKRELLLMAKMNAFQILVQGELKLKREDAKAILETVCNQVVQP